MIIQKRPFSTQHRRAVSYDKNSSQQKQYCSINDKKQLNNTRRLHSNPSKQSTNISPAIESAKTARMSTIIKTSQSTTHKISRPTTTTASKLTTLPILPSSDTINYLDYSRHKITTVPKNFAAHYLSLTRLNLAHNELAQLLPLCYLHNLEELILAGNFINCIPKEIKKLTRLNNIDLSDNKLWYLSQIVALKDLVVIRVDQMNESIQINLQGNSVLKTNQKAVRKLLSSTSYNYEQRQQLRPQIRAVVKEILEQSKQNIHPNIMKVNKYPSTLNNKKQAHQKSKSSKNLNQSLLDVSAIMGPLPKSIIDQNINEFQTFSQTLFLKKQQTSAKETQQLQNVNEETPLLSNYKELNSNRENISQSVNVLFSQSQERNQSPIDETDRNKQLALLFGKVHNFENDFIEPFGQYLKEMKKIQKNLKLIQNIKEIPESLKTDFLSVNKTLLKKITITQDILAPFENFYSSDILSITAQAEQKINQAKQSDVGFKSFHQKIFSTFLNSSETAEIRWYQVWLNQFNNFRQMIDKIEKLMNQFIVLSKKVHQFSKVTLSLNSREDIKPLPKTNPNQQYNFQQESPSKKTSSKKQLNQLLFSDTKYQRTHLFSSSKKQSLLLSQKQSRSGKNDLFYQDCPKPNPPHPCNQNCLDCPIKDQQIIQLNLSLNHQKEKNLQLTTKIEQLNQEIDKFMKSKDFYQKIEQNQAQIIDQISQIKPSTYQNVLLSQAQCIEELIHGNEQGLQKSKLFSTSLNNQYHNQRQDKALSYFKQPSSNNNFIQDSLNKKVTMSKNTKIELNQFLLTEQSMSSNKKKTPQVLQRTYFKSNKNLPFSQSNTVKNYASKVSGQTINSKISSSKTTSQLKKFDDKVLLNDFEKEENQRNQVFRNIIVGEFEKDKGGENQRLSSNGVVSNKYEQKFDSDQNKNIYKSNKNKQNRGLADNRNDQNQVFIFSLSNNLQANQSLSPLKSKKRSKTQSSLHAHDFKELSPFGYDYKEIQLKQNVQYQKYLKHHLRNNIKQILERKISISNNHAVLDNMRNSISTDFFQKHFSHSNLFVSFKGQNQNDRASLHRLARSSSNMKKNPSGKFIKQHRYTDGK